ncbi:MAG: type II toxin-antitoxin system PemK/MazF family toxin [Spirosomataceae bacterium]
MATFVKGEIVVLPFPFSDLSASKRRPALVLADLQGDDIILCQITSQFNRDQYAVELTQNDLAVGSLSVQSAIRPNRLFTADKKIIAYSLGHISASKYQEVIQRIYSLISV